VLWPGIGTMVVIAGVGGGGLEEGELMWDPDAGVSVWTFRALETTRCSDGLWGSSGHGHRRSSLVIQASSDSGSGDERWGPIGELRWTECRRVKPILTSQTGIGNTTEGSDLGPVYTFVSSICFGLPCPHQMSESLLFFFSSFFCAGIKIGTLLCHTPAHSYSCPIFCSYACFSSFSLHICCTLNRFVYLDSHESFLSNNCCICFH
jgi:hypothetical protein